MNTRILLADDHEILREGLRLILKRQDDMEVVGEAAHGREAVEMARDAAVDVVIMDIAMPDLNGMDATRLILDQNPDIRVIALSAYRDQRYILEMIRAGAMGYVIKSDAGEELIRAIQSVIGHKLYLPPGTAETVLQALSHRDGAAKGRASHVLSTREREVLQLVAEGKTSPEVAGQLFLSVRTVEAHRRNIMQKLGINSVAELTKYAIREGLTSLDQ